MRASERASPFAVIAHAHVEPGSVEAQRRAHLGGLRVTRHIRQRLLNHAVDRGRVRLLHFDIVMGNVQAGHETGALLELVEQIFDRRHEAEIIEHEGTQVRGNTPHGGDCRVDHTEYAFHPVAEALFGRQAGGHPRRVHFQRGKPLGELIVQLARDAGALGFPYLVHRCVQLPQSRVGQFELVAGALPLGHVAQNDREKLSALDRHLRDRRFERELLAVGAQPHKDELLTHAPHRHAGRREALRCDPDAPRDNVEV